MAPSRKSKAKSFSCTRRSCELEFDNISIIRLTRTSRKNSIWQTEYELAARRIEFHKFSSYLANQESKFIKSMKLFQEAEECSERKKKLKKEAAIVYRKVTELEQKKRKVENIMPARYPTGDGHAYV